MWCSLMSILWCLSSYPGPTHNSRRKYWGLLILAIMIHPMWNIGGIMKLWRHHIMNILLWIWSYSQISWQKVPRLFINEFKKTSGYVRPFLMTQTYASNCFLVNLILEFHGNRYCHLSPTWKKNIPSQMILYKGGRFSKNIRKGVQCLSLGLAT